MDNSNRIALCNEALESLKSLIPDELYKDVNDFINKFDEWGLGMEVLIDQISEYEIMISEVQFEKIKIAMDSMDLGDSNRIQYLWENDVIHP